MPTKEKRDASVLLTHVAGVDYSSCICCQLSFEEFPPYTIEKARGLVVEKRVLQPGPEEFHLPMTQVKPKDKQLGGLSFFYGGTESVKLQVEIRASWRNIRRNGDDELGKPRIAASAD
ncbi:hypothetical protein SESBI_04711 [Sesbania bispinosa]|nr:hypothetical protein SESBI_04711 [Sesbania bispinosa]